MKVLFQNPRWATATFSVSASATCATAAVVKPSSKAIILFMAFSHSENTVFAACPQAKLSILLDILLPHHAAPARKLVAQELAEFRARRRRWNGAGLHELVAHVGRVQRGDDGVVQFRHHRRRRAGRRQQAVPAVGGAGGGASRSERA